MRSKSQTKNPVGRWQRVAKKMKKRAVTVAKKGRGSGGRAW